MKSIILIIILVLVGSCYSPANKSKEDTNKNESLSQVQKKEEPVQVIKKDAIKLLQTKENNNLENGKLSNIDSTNGFRGLKLNSSFDQLHFIPRWEVYDLEDEGTSKMKLASIDISYTDPNTKESFEVYIGENRIDRVDLFFQDNKLICIELFLKLYIIDFPDSKIDTKKANTLYKDLIGVFGQPQKPLGKEKGIEKFNYKGAIWQTKNVTMELALNESYIYYRDGKEIHASPTSNMYFYVTEKSKYIEPYQEKAYLKTLVSDKKPEKLLKEF